MIVQSNRLKTQFKLNVNSNKIKITDYRFTIKAIGIIMY